MPPFEKEAWIGSRELTRKAKILQRGGKKHKFRKISFAFNIFVSIPMQEMVYLKTIIKSAPMGVSASGTTGQKTYLKKFRGGLSTLSPPLDPPTMLCQ